MQDSAAQWLNEGQLMVLTYPMVLAAKFYARFEVLTSAFQVFCGVTLRCSVNGHRRFDATFQNS
jgi:hypothetical protein